MQHFSRYVIYISYDNPSVYIHCDDEMANGPRWENFGEGEYERLLQSDEDGDGSRVPEDRGSNYDDDGDAEERDPQTTVGFGQKVSYGLGHVFNDIAATIWFSYTMVFMQDVVGMPPTTAGFLLFFG